ncbi:acylphosphatase [Oceanobacillus sp. 1P07AA]|uniref:acylphosphatase n=1 Tax=Oceanobacillus sp. 1P07AA TaxID=3132293 RepID=UPI0039A529DC
MRHVKVNVKGQVQGVGFRYFTQSLANENAIVGWVRNEDDGSVLIEAQGEQENMKNFLAEVENGPTKFSRVQDMDVSELEEDSRLTKFEVKY